MKREKGFTLIELLVVISLIGLLSSIVLASLSSARDKGNIAAGETFNNYNYHFLGVGALGSWSFDEGSGDAIDSSGNNRNLTEGATFGRSATTLLGSGRSASFPGGTNNYAKWTSPFGAVPMTNYTVSAWVYFASLPGNDEGIIATQNASNFRLSNMYYAGSNSSIICGHELGTWLLYVPSLQTNKWYQITCSWNETTLTDTMYINGRQVASSVNTTNVSSLGGISTINVGNVSNGSGAQTVFSGLIDDVNIYTQSLTSSDVYKLYAEGLPKHLLAQR